MSQRPKHSDANIVIFFGHLQLKNSGGVSECDAEVTELEVSWREDRHTDKETVKEADRQTNIRRPKGMHCG